MSEYSLKHNNDTVLLLDIDEKYRFTKAVIVNKEKVPLGLLEKNDTIDIYEFNDWFNNRGIPVKRDGIEYILQKEKKETVNELLIKNNGLGLCDHYWIEETKLNTKWADINYFDNDNNFNRLGDDIYLGKKNELEIKEDKTPNCSLSGMQPKRWILINGERWLLKGKEATTEQEPFSEVAASLFLDKLRFDHVEYKLIEMDNKTLSGCRNMLNSNQELIHSYYANKFKKFDDTSSYEMYISNLTALGIKDDITTELEKMIVVDYLIANTDRHWSNFGIIRNSDTMKYERIAPLYDHAASFFTKTNKISIFKDNENLSCRSFKTTQDENLKLVKNIDWLNFDALKDLPDILRDTLNKNKASEPNRNDIIIKCITTRIHTFKKILGLTTKDKTVNIHNKYNIDNHNEFKR